MLGANKRNLVNRKMIRLSKLVENNIANFKNFLYTQISRFCRRSHSQQKSVKPLFLSKNRKLKMRSRRMKMDQLS